MFAGFGHHRSNLGTALGRVVVFGCCIRLVDCPPVGTFERSRCRVFLLEMPSGLGSCETRSGSCGGFPPPAVESHHTRRKERRLFLVNSLCIESPKKLSRNSIIQGKTQGIPRRGLSQTEKTKETKETTGHQHHRWLSNTYKDVLSFPSQLRHIPTATRQASPPKGPPQSRGSYGGKART